MDEDELYDVISDSGFFGILGYDKIGKDIRKQKAIAGSGKKPDFYCLDDFQNVVFVLEAKKPSDEHLEDAFAQLWDLYVLPLKSKHGVLTNGNRIIVYSRTLGGTSLLLDRELNEISKAECDRLALLLKKPDHELGTLENLRDYLSKAERLSLQNPQARQFFRETFALTPDSIYGELVNALLALFDDSLPKSKFLRGAWSYWIHSLARSPQTIPDVWKQFLGEKFDEDALVRFMFCLETAQALLARLMLAKACQDYGFPDVDLYDFVLKRVPNDRGAIQSIGYPVVLSQLLKEMEGLLVSSVFEEDIFTWWTDPFLKFVNVPGWSLREQDVSTATEEFSVIVARMFLVFYKYDFLNLPSDVLGDLYQTYFDRETRRALGEFYTPEEIVDYIVDGVNYRNISNKRLLDPSCGSGSFLVAAVRRYLQEAKPLVVSGTKRWPEILSELCESPRIVGLDINPFAILMAQVRFLLEILPYYKLSIEKSGAEGFRLHRLPIFRTDSLAKETIPLGLRGQTLLVETENELKFPVPLPITGPTGVMQVEVAIPSWPSRLTVSEGMLINLDEYFRSAQALFDGIKASLRKGRREVSLSDLETAFGSYLRRKNNARLAEIFKPYADQIFSAIAALQSEFEDGRLVKSIEDSVLAAILKNKFKYDYVVGNPPYVQINGIPEDSREYYYRVYATATGRMDLYVLFLDRGIDWLNPGGRLGYIVSNKFMLAEYGKYIRPKIRNSCTLDQIIDFGDSGVFSEVTNYPSILVLSSRSGAIAGSFRYVRVVKPRQDLISDIRAHVSKPEYTDDFIESYLVSSSSLSAELWAFGSPKELKLRDKIKQATNLSLRDVTKEIRRGVNPGSDKAFVLDSAEVEKLRLEDALLHPFVAGDEVKRWGVEWKGRYVIFPYERRLGRVELVDITKYPKTLKYLEENRRELEGRYSVKKGGKRWYAFHDPSKSTAYHEECIVTPDISQGSRFAIGDEQYIFKDTCYVIIPKERLLLILALLNSRVLEFYFRQSSPFVSGKYYRYKTQYLEILPIKLPRSKIQEELAGEIEKHARRIVQAADKGKLLDSFPGKYLSQMGPSTELDEILVKFSDNHQRLEPTITGTSNSGYTLYPSEGEDGIWLENESLAKYVQLALANRNVGRDDTMRILVPRDRDLAARLVSEFMRDFRNDTAASLEEMERSLESLVAEYYGLDEDDIQILDNYLARSVTND